MMEVEEQDIEEESPEVGDKILNENELDQLWEKGPKEEPETPTVPTPTTPPTTIKGKKPGKWFQKIPQEILLSPGGMILIFFALGMEIIDLIPAGGIDTLTWELGLEAIFMVLLSVIAHIPFQSMVLPFIIERIPGISDVLPSWLIRLFI